VASLITHPIVPLGLALALGPSVVPRRLLIAAIAASMVPDADTIGLRLGVDYGALWGHRGMTHSLSFAAALGALGALAAPALGAKRLIACALIFLSAASHGLLDSLTTGGLGIAFFSPFDRTRYFLPWNPIEVSPIGIRAFFSSWGLRVIKSELVYVWAPMLALALAGAGLRRRLRGPQLG